MIQHISGLFPDLPESSIRPKIKNSRQYVVSLFLEHLNTSRGNLKPLAASFVAFKMSHMTVEQLYGFLAQCEKSNSGFSKYWWWSLDTKKHEGVDKVPYAKKPFRRYTKPVSEN